MHREPKRRYRPQSHIGGVMRKAVPNTATRGGGFGVVLKLKNYACWDGLEEEKCDE
jgi:hypothetical protein